MIVNGISAARERFLNAGGLGILVGDGQLPHPGSERILESYYNVAILQQVHLTLDYQWVDHPAYNLDRGPVSIWASSARTPSSQFRSAGLHTPRRSQLS